jgi:NAD(P)-dependent dehydrogenase (short-subunit alcohol dehydrogenase family)
MSRILITGASTGVGRATAIELATRGHDVVATARDESTLADLDVAARLRLDVTDQASVDAATAAAGAVDVLVNNAGISLRGPIESYPMDLVQQVFETNTFGALRMMQSLAPGMRTRGHGVIVNVSSVEGFVTSPLGGIYSASKHALEALSEAAKLELGHFGIRVVIIEPGYFATPIQHTTRPVPIDGTPYAELQAQWQGADKRLLGGERPGPEVVARAIADAIEADDSPLRVPVGADAELVAAVRRSADDAAFEAAMRDTLGLTW